MPTLGGGRDGSVVYPCHLLGRPKFNSCFLACAPTQPMVIEGTSGRKSISRYIHSLFFSNTFFKKWKPKEIQVNRIQKFASFLKTSPRFCVVTATWYWAEDCVPLRERELACLHSTKLKCKRPHTCRSWFPWAYLCSQSLHPYQSRKQERHKDGFRKRGREHIPYSFIEQKALLVHFWYFKFCLG